MFMCNTAWSGSKSHLREVSKLKKQITILICLILGTCTAGAVAFAGPVTSLTQPSVLERITEDAASDAAAIVPTIHVGGASSAKRAAERAVGGRAVRVVRKGRRFVVTVISGGNAKRCIVDAQSGQVLRCR